MPTSYLIKLYQENYNDAKVRIPIVQKKIDDLKLEIAKLRLSKDIIDSYIRLGLENELKYCVRLMNCLLDHRAQATKKLANLRKRKGDF